MNKLIRKVMIRKVIRKVVWRVIMGHSSRVASLPHIPPEWHPSHTRVVTCMPPTLYSRVETSLPHIIIVAPIQQVSHSLT